MFTYEDHLQPLTSSLVNVLHDLGLFLDQKVKAHEGRHYLLDFVQVLYHHSAVPTQGVISSLHSSIFDLRGGFAVLTKLLRLVLC